jgi:hypothetical protein
MFTLKSCDDSIRLLAFGKSIFEAVGRVAELRDLRAFDMVLFPILQNRHFYVVACDLKNPGLYLIDNMNKDETIVELKDSEDYFKKSTPYKVVR